MQDFHQIIADIQKINETLLEAFKAKEKTIRENNIKIRELINKIDRSVTDCARDSLAIKIGSYNNLIDLINRQNDVLVNEQKTLLACWSKRD